MRRIDLIDKISSQNVVPSVKSMRVLDEQSEAECVFTAKDGTNTSYDCKYNTTTKTWTCTVAEKTGSATTNERTGSNTLNN